MPERTAEEISQGSGLQVAIVTDLLGLGFTYSIDDKGLGLWTAPPLEHLLEELFTTTKQENTMTNDKHDAENRTHDAAAARAASTDQTRTTPPTTVDKTTTRDSDGRNEP
jgi:hypothetical protein